MNHLGLTFHHIGLAVSEPDKAIAFLSELGYQIGPTIHDPLQKVHLNMCTHASNPAVEIISPDKDNDKGPINELTRKNSSGIVYHTCYVTNDLAATLAHAKTLGLHVFCVSAPKPAPLFENRKVSFYKISGMGLIEIIEPLESAESEVKGA
jgi:methylmalonyl-CoA/ethylmalonyl-CoA epimerase